MILRTILIEKTTLKKLGPKKKILGTNDFLFFYQLIIPICNTEKSGIRGGKDSPTTMPKSRSGPQSNVHTDWTLGG